MERRPERPLILASVSPRRRELLLRVGLPIEVVPAAVDEATRGEESAVGHAARLAAAKAGAVADRHADRWVLGADTVVEIDGLILGKAESAAAARTMLQRLAGRAHRVSTAFSLRGPAAALGSRVVTTHVTMRAATTAELDDYVASGEWQGKAGAYAVQGIAAALVREVRGSITNVIGLPLAEVIEELRRLGGPTPRYAAGEPT
jgi:septum formation protein